MSHPEEAVLKTESGIGPKQRGDKKYRFNPPMGTLILTDRRLIFAESGGEFAKRLVAGGLLGIIGSEALRGVTKVKAEELDKALERSESFQVNLKDISEVKTEKQLGVSFLSVQWSAPQQQKALFYRTGVFSSFVGFDEWINQILTAKQRLTIPVAPSPSQEVPSPYSTHPQTQPSYDPAIANPPATPQGVTSTVFCTNCGARMASTDLFCRSCGTKQK